MITQANKSTILMVFLIFALIGIVCTIIGAVSLITTAADLQSYEKAEAKIIDTGETKTDIEYQINGTVYNTTVEYANSLKHKGDRIEILYKPNNHYDVKANTFLNYLFPVLMGGVGILYDVICFIIWNAFLKKRK